MVEKSSKINLREEEILKFIEKQIKIEGYPPSVREIGKAVGLSSTATVHGYLSKLEEKGYIKKQDKKGRTLKLLKNSLGESLLKSNKQLCIKKEVVEVPIIEEITSKELIFAVDNIKDTFTASTEFTENSETFMFAVKGQNMQEVGILDGDYILVRKQNTANNGDIVVALVEKEVIVKTFYKDLNNIRLQSENLTMSYITLLESECEILGKVIGVIRKL